MGYDILARGTVVQSNGRPHRYPDYIKHNRAWGDEWEMNKLADVALSMSGINTGGSISGDLTVNAVKSLALSTFKRLLGESLQILTIDSYGELSIFTTNKNLLWADELHFGNFSFTQNTVSQQFQRLLKFFVEADLNKMGPLMDLCFALSSWDKEGRSGRYLYRISYTWS